VSTLTLAQRATWVNTFFDSAMKKFMAFIDDGMWIVLLSTFLLYTKSKEFFIRQNKTTRFNI